MGYPESVPASCFPLFNIYFLPRFFLPCPQTLTLPLILFLSTHVLLFSKPSTKTRYLL
ncbi:hypothetical protein BDY24DRAFT_402891 [Mrakia frigida]|uniref:uncharacterized protein n=1 Tax=Mrakia frigida TaxID=29902 RepID=UPI003FCC227E